MLAWLSGPFRPLLSKTTLALGLRSKEPRELLTACLLLCLAALFCFHRLTWHPTDILVGPHDAGRTDLTTAFGAMRQFQGESLREGSWPTWNAQLLCGLPFLGNPQSGFFYPLNWIFFLLPSLSLLSWMMVVHHAIAGIGTYLLMRRYGCGFWPAVAAGTAFLVGPFMVAATAEGHYTQTCVIAWIPWAAWGYERIRRGETGGNAITAGAVSLSFFGGHAQETMYLVFLLSGFLGIDCFHAYREQQRTECQRLMTAWVTLMLTVFGLVMIELLPIWIYTKQAVRAGGIDAATASSISLGWTNFWQLLDPTVLGGPGEYRGEGHYYWETLCYFGTVVLMLALVAMTFRTRQYPVGRWTVFAILTLLFALGDDTPLFPFLHRYLPGVSFFRSPSRSLYFTTLALSVLAGMGLQSMLAWVSSPAFNAVRRRRSVSLVLAAMGCLALGFCSPELPGIGPLSLLLPAWFLTLALGLFAILVVCPSWRPVIGAALVLLVLTEGAWHAHQVTATIPMQRLRPSQPVQRFFTENLRAGRVIAEQDLLSDREAIVFRLPKMGGLEGVPLARSAIPLVMLSQHSQAVAQLVGFDPIDLTALPKTLLDLTGIQYAAITPDPAGPLTLRGWELIEHGEMAPEFTLRGAEPKVLPYAIYAVEDPMPRAFVLGQVQLLRSNLAMQEQIRRLNPREEVLLEKDLLPPGDRQPFQPVDWIEDRGDRLRIAATLTAPGYLVVSDTFFPGWTARVAGQPVPVVPANVGFRAVPLGPGRHEVILEFWPPGLNFGAICSVTTLILVIVLTRRPLSVNSVPVHASANSSRERLPVEEPTSV
jgi:hypothetical protein